MCYKAAWSVFPGSWLKLDTVNRRQALARAFTLKTIWRVTSVLNGERSESRWQYSVILNVLPFFARHFLKGLLLLLLNFIHSSPAWHSCYSVWVLCMGILWKVSTFQSPWRTVHVYGFRTNERNLRSYSSGAQDNPSVSEVKCTVYLVFSVSSEYTAITVKY